VIWVATANDERAIPEPILNRMNVFEVQMPDRDAARTIARRLYRQIRGAARLGPAFAPEPADERARPLSRPGAARDAPRLDDGLRQRPARPAAAPWRCATCPTPVRGAADRLHALKTKCSFQCRHLAARSSLLM
jgi:hypothetical protein